MKIKKKVAKTEKPMTKAQEKKLLKKAVNKAFSLWGEIGRLETGDTCELCGAHRGDLKDNGKPTILNGHHLRRTTALCASGAISSAGRVPTGEPSSSTSG